MTTESKNIPWKRLTISDGTQFLYLISNGNSSFILTDLVRIFEYKFPEDILSKNEEFNPALEFSEDSDVYEEMNRILESKDSKKVFKNANLEVEDNDDEMPFTWIFECKERDGKFFYEQVTQSLLNGMSRLWEERSILLKVVKDKDLELEALYVEDDATLTRKSLKTKRFNEESLFAASLDNPFQLLTSELYLEFLNKSPKKRLAPTYKSVDKKLKMTSNNLFDDNEEDPNNATSTTTSSSSTPTSSPIKISRITDDKAMKKNQMKKKLKKL